MLIGITVYLYTFDPRMSYKNKIKNWEGFAKTDPLWSILTDPNKKDGKWDVDEFFKTGKDEIDIVFNYLEKNNVSPTNKQRAIDFGCGVGRLTRAIHTRFDDTLGIDASSQMVFLANKYHEDITELNFKQNTTDHLHFIEDKSISFIYTAIVLQHIPPKVSYNFIAEFCRILESGGTLVFQLPTADLRKLTGIQKFRTWLKLRERLSNVGVWKKYHMDMNIYQDDRIRTIVENQGCEVADRAYTNHTEKAFNGHLKFLSKDEATDFVSSFYIVRRP